MHGGDPAGPRARRGGVQQQGQAIGGLDGENGFGCRSQQCIALGAGARFAVFHLMPEGGMGLAQFPEARRARGGEPRGTGAGGENDAAAGGQAQEAGGLDRGGFQGGGFRDSGHAKIVTAFPAAIQQ